VFELMSSLMTIGSLLSTEVTSMQQRTRVARVLILLLGLFVAGCDQAGNITAPRQQGPLAFALTPERVAELLNVVDGSALPTDGTAQPGNGDEVALMLSLPAPNGQQHYLFVESRAVDVATVFTMGTGSITVDGTTINYIDLNATGVGSSDSNDIGRGGFPAESVVLCLAEPELEPGQSANIYWLADQNTIVQMTRIERGNLPAHVCAEIPHFSGFVMGAN
jgi:hypothetical protein